MVGVVWGVAEKPPSAELRDVERVLDETPLLPESLLPFLEWTAGYYFYPVGKVIAEALPPGLLSASGRRIELIRRAGPRKRRSPPRMPHWYSSRPASLTGEQEAALRCIRDAVASGSFRPILVHGVTGSGKTEVYLQACEECLSRGRSALILVPEIAMTAQAVGLFADRFPDEITVLHSGLTEGQRRDQWYRIRQGMSRVVVGTRSAVFAPLPDLGLVVVDEEHDPSYKQEEKLRYHGRDLAVMRASFFGATVILGSATPAVTSYHHALRGRYRLILLRKRVAERALPDVDVVDRRGRGKKTRRRSAAAPPFWMTEILERGLRETLGRGEQALLFLNRRGFATHVFCPACGHVFRCPRCDIGLTWHRGSGQQARPGKTSGAGPGPDGLLQCHYCGLQSPALPLCPRCRSQAVRTSGYGTQRIAADLAAMFPDARVARLDRDAMGSRERMERVLLDFHSGCLDVLVGTQMVAKGHDFPGLTLVGIVWADLSLNFPEYHAAERTFQLLGQVAGRAGRGIRPGRVIVQTWLPDHFAIECARTHDYARFFERETALRAGLGYPPFGRLINLRFSGRNGVLVADTALRTAETARRLASSPGRQWEAAGAVEVMGPAPAPRTKLKDRYRWQILLKSPSLAAVRGLCADVLEVRSGLVPSGVKLDVDVDPSSLL